ncbi:MAG: flagellar basal body P-ring formation chaperone FlgA [Thermodesulfovibrionales bacterium]
MSTVRGGKRRFGLLFAGLLLAASLFDGRGEAATRAALMEEIRQAVAKELEKSLPGELELEGVRVTRGGEGLDGGGDYRIGGATMNGYVGRNKVALTVLLTDGKGETKNIAVEALYDMMVDVFVSSKPLAGGSFLADGDVVVVRQKSSRLPVGAVTDKKELEGRALRSNIGQGVVLRTAYLAPQGSVKRGQKVTVVVEGDSVVVSTQGQLRSDATVGGSARVYCESSKKEVVGLLEAPGVVRVRL